MSSKKAAVSITEIVKRVPPNQLNQFHKFSSKYHEYARKMNKFPSKLPKINWAEYKARVRPESQPLLEEFEKKYEELNKIFDDRAKLDNSRYYKELEAEKKVVMEEISKFKKGSDERIKKIEAELQRYKNLKPYKDMTIEEFCILMPEKAVYVPYYGNNNLFWPFDKGCEIPGPQSLRPHDLDGHDDEIEDKTLAKKGAGPSKKKHKKPTKQIFSTKPDPEPKHDPKLKKTTATKGETKKAAESNVKAEKKSKAEDKLDTKSKGKGQPIKKDSTKNKSTDDKKKDN